MAGDARRLRLGIIGLGQAGAMVLDDIKAAPGLPWTIAAAADPRAHARQRFHEEFGGAVFADAAELCRSPDIDVVYVATPAEMHREHATLAAQGGKHVIVEKPMALSLADAVAIVEAAERGGVRLLAGHTHSFDAPIRKIAELVAGGELGPLRAINCWNFNEFNHRPRQMAELVTTHGPVLNQGPHHVDIVRQIGGGTVRSVRATTIPDAVTGVTGGYVCYLELAERVPVTLVYDGRSLFDTAELFDWVGEGGDDRDRQSAPRRRREFLDLMGRPPAERDAVLAQGKEAGRYGGATAGRLENSWAAKQHPHQPFFGLIVVSCEDATIRQSAGGLYVYDKDGRREIAVAQSQGGRIAELTEMYNAIVTGRAPFHDGAWGLATLEVCFAILESARTGTEITMVHQTTH
ncbi:MAG: oxidoreductase domain protein [Rhodospirillales bacterium]|nr:oxidoreductase domain protein [Rhodospirillales bacterium]